MSEPNASQPTLRILPPDTTAPTPDQTTEPATPPTVEVRDEEPDTGKLLDEVIDGKHAFVWPKDSVVGDGTPGPGRRPIDIDERIVKAMAMVGGTTQEIAEFFGCSDTVIQKRFGDVVRAARAGRKLRLRQAQYQLAIAGNATMQIWLGKQELGQFDESRVRVGNLNNYSDEELQQLAQGKVPGQLGRGENSVDKEEKD